MMYPSRSSFAAVCQTEWLFNARRAAPYVIAALFSANAVFWWAGGPAVSRGWATNSDFFIVRLFGGFTFMTLPLFIALLMGDPVIRDFEAGIDPLLFSKPVRRAEYLLGKFVGNFSVLVGCQAAFAVTLLILQLFATEGMVVLPPRALPYGQHFVVLVVCSTLLPAAVCFAVGALTRNVKVVYGLMASFYLVYGVYQVSIKTLAPRWRVLLDPLLFNINIGIDQQRGAEWVNHAVVGYDGGMLLNRLLVILAAALCLVVVHVRFSILPAFSTGRHASQTSIAFRGPRTARVAVDRSAVSRGRVRSAVDQWAAATIVELRLLLAERSIIVIAPMAVAAGLIGSAYYGVNDSPAYSAAYASRSVESLLLMICVTSVLFTTEAMFRDRIVRFEPVLWSTPASNSALVLSKCVATLLVAVSLASIVGLCTVGLQLIRGHSPVITADYLRIYGLVLMPSAVVSVAVATLMCVLCRDKYVAYAAIFGLGGAMYFLYAQGHNAWWYNPVMYGLWTPADLTGDAPRLGVIVLQRFYWLAVATLLLVAAHVRYPRR